MHIILLIFTIFILSSCMKTIEVPSSKVEQSNKKIISNQIDAKDAREEYKRIQASRE